MVFQKYALMEYGSMFGDGAYRGPDYSAEALHQTAEVMSEFYNNHHTGKDEGDKEIIQLGISNTYYGTKPGNPQ